MLRGLQTRMGDSSSADRISQLVCENAKLRKEVAELEKQRIAVQNSLRWRLLQLYQKVKSLLSRSPRLHGTRSGQEALDKKPHVLGEHSARVRGEGGCAQEGLPFGINVAGYIDTESGLGEAVRGTIRALDQAGIPYSLTNIPSNLRAEDRSYDGFRDDNPYSINCVHLNADSAHWFRRLQGSSYYADRYNISHWVWELSRFREDWESAFLYYDEIWVPSEFVQNAVLPPSPIPVIKVPYSVSVDATASRPRSYFGLPETKFVFLFACDVSSYMDRKNPMAVIRAFRKAFGRDRDVLLVMKLVNQHYNRPYMQELQQEVEGLNVVLRDGYMSRADTNALMSASDCYVSLHRSEGFGLTMAEAMGLGKPVIATGYSGNMEFMNPRNSYLVRYSLREIEHDIGPYSQGCIWAEPDEEHAAELMRRVYLNREEAHGLATQASRDIRDRFSPRAIGEIIKRRLAELGFLEAGQ